MSVPQVLVVVSGRLSRRLMFEFKKMSLLMMRREEKLWLQVKVNTRSTHEGGGPQKNTRHQQAQLKSTTTVIKFLIHSFHVVGEKKRANSLWSIENNEDQ